MIHEYLSTGCLHDAHEYCNLATLRADGTRKRPARCKFCDAPCICDCHRSTTEEQGKWLRP